VSAGGVKRERGGEGYTEESWRSEKKSIRWVKNITELERHGAATHATVQSKPAMVPTWPPSSQARDIASMCISSYRAFRHPMLTLCSLCAALPILS
jgi:hypothetical protein